MIFTVIQLVMSTLIPYLLVAILVTIIVIAVRLKKINKTIEDFELVLDEEDDKVVPKNKVNNKKK